MDAKRLRTTISDENTVVGKHLIENDTKQYCTMTPDIKITDLKKNQTSEFIDPSVSYRSKNEKKIPKDKRSENQVTATSSTVMDSVNRFAPDKSVTPSDKTIGWITKKMKKNR